jgi:hypothetical protein
MTEPNWWRQPRWPWQLKTDRAQHYIDDLATQVNDFGRRVRWEISPESGSQPGETNYRLRISEPVPATFSVIIGDVLHNLRSALDCAAFEIAQRHAGRALTEKEERDAVFPVHSKPSELQGFFQSGQRPQLFGLQEQQAFAAVQPGWSYDDQVNRGHTPADGRDEEVRYHP